MKKKLGIPKSRPLADFLPTITIKAKDFAGEITHFNVKKQNLIGENLITHEHEKNNKDVRKILKKSNIFPEKLPPEEDIKRIEKQIEKKNKQFMENPKVLPQKNQK